MLATLAGGLALHVRVASLASLAVVLAIGTWCRRFGPLGFNGGVLAFMGAFLGFFIQDYVPLGRFGWLAAEIWLGALVTMAVHFTFFRPRPEPGRPPHAAFLRGPGPRGGHRDHRPVRRPSAPGPPAANEPGSGPTGRCSASCCG